jgi:hypothetical protein
LKERIGVIIVANRQIPIDTWGAAAEKGAGVQRKSSESEQWESKAMKKGRKAHAQDRKAKSKRGRKSALESKWERGKCTNLHGDGQEKQNLKKRSKVSAPVPASGGGLAPGFTLQF